MVDKQRLKLLSKLTFEGKNVTFMSIENDEIV